MNFGLIGTLISLLGNDSDNMSSFTSGTTREYPEKHNNCEGEGEKEIGGE